MHCIVNIVDPIIHDHINKYEYNYKVYCIYLFLYYYFLFIYCIFMHSCNMLKRHFMSSTISFEENPAL